MNKRNTIILILMLALSSSLLFAQFSGGSGTEADPYRISTRDDYKALLDLIHSDSFEFYGKYFIQTNNISFPPYESNYFSFIHAVTFCCNFNAQNYSFIQHHAYGIFIKIDGGKISNSIVISNNGVIGENASNLYPSIVNNTVIENCIKINYSVPRLDFPGVSNIVRGVHGNNVQIKNCMNISAMNFINGEYYGGIVGYMSPDNTNIIENCINYSSIIGKLVRNIGGIVGNNPSVGQIRNCVNVGVVINNYNDDLIGGIASPD